MTDTGGSGGSRQTDSGGWGVYDAALDARRQLFVAAVSKAQADARKANKERPQINPDDLTIDGKFVKSTTDPSIPDVDLERRQRLGHDDRRSRCPPQRRSLGAHLLRGARRGGRGRHAVRAPSTVTRYVAVHDVGRVINLLGVEQQIEGGVIMSLGSTLYEEMLTDQATGLPLNRNMLDYGCPRSRTCPDKIEVYFVEKPKEYGVYGAHGIGEPPMGPPGADHRQRGLQRGRRVVRRAARSRAHRLAGRGEAVGVREDRQHEAVRPLRADHRQRGGGPAEPVRRQSKGRRAAAAICSAA